MAFSQLLDLRGGLHQLIVTDWYTIGVIEKKKDGIGPESGTEVGLFTTYPLVY